MTEVILVSNNTDVIYENPDDMKTSMISTTLAIFCGLQEDLKQVLCDLPEDASLQLKLGLFDAYCKLSDCYYKYDESPFYMWATCMYSFFIASVSDLIIYTILNPRISYGGMKADYGDNEALSEYLEDSNAKLVDYFKKNYMKSHGSTPIQTPRVPLQH